MRQNQSRKDGRKEDSEDSVLQRLNGVVKLEESKGNNKANGEMGEKTSPLVISVSPESDISYITH